MLKLRIIFSKSGPAAYLSHLDVMRTFARSFHRADIPLRHTEGFNPHPYLSIAHPLPVGFTSGYELLDCEVLNDNIESIADRMNASLPGGFEVLSVSVPEKPVSDIAYAEYRITYLYDGTMPDRAAERLSAFFSAPDIAVEKKGKKGPVQINLPDYYESIEFVRVSDRELSAKAILKVKDAPLNPRYFSRAIPDEDLRPDFSRYHRVGFYDSDMKLFAEI